MPIAQLTRAKPVIHGVNLFHVKRKFILIYSLTGVKNRFTLTPVFTPIYRRNDMSEAKTGPITFEEVLSAVEAHGDIPNAGKMRQLLGNRGSNSTIQNHLNTIRDSRKPAPAPAPVAPGAAPAEAVAALWAAATTAVTAHIYTRMESISAERDTLKEQVQQLTQDLSAALEDSDAARAEADAARTAAAADADTAGEALEEMERVQTQFATATAAAAAAQEAATAEIKRITEAAAAASALAAKETALKTQELQSALDRQIDKYVELRGMLDRLTPAQDIKR